MWIRRVAAATSTQSAEPYTPCPRQTSKASTTVCRRATSAIVRVADGFPKFRNCKCCRNNTSTPTTLHSIVSIQYVVAGTTLNDTATSDTAVPRQYRWPRGPSVAQRYLSAYALLALLPNIKVLRVVSAHQDERYGRGVTSGGFFFFVSSHFTFQLLGKPWSQVSSLLPPGSCLQFLSRMGFSNPTARRFSIECC